MTKIEALREKLSSHGYKGFIIPRGDEFFGEEVPLDAERLKYLTGFSGSAGAAVVLQNKAAMFVDGRYTLQVKQQVDNDAYEFYNSRETPFEDWLTRNIGEGDKIAYDPWLHSSDAIEKLERRINGKGAELVAIDDNPIDEIWLDRPYVEVSNIFDYPLELAGKSREEKISEIAAQLREEKIDAFFAVKTDAISWLLNIRSNELEHSPVVRAFAIIYADEKVDLFVGSERLDFSLGDKVTIVPPSKMEAIVMGLDGKKIGVDYHITPHAIVKMLKKAGLKTRSLKDLCSYPMACKNKVELASIKSVHKIDAVAMCRFLEWLDANALNNQTEISLSDKLEAFRAMSDKFVCPSFATISAFADNGAIVHYHAEEKTNKKIESGIYLLDSGGQYMGGTTDITRTIYIGCESSAEQKERFTLVLKGHIALAMAKFPADIAGRNLDILARKALWENGLDYDHGTGHGVGCFMNVHEGPQSISPRTGNAEIKEGMIISNEPGYYKEGEYGIRIENLICVSKADLGANAEREMLCFETITLVPIDLKLVDECLLEPKEKAWLNDYHARVYKEISPLLDDSTWLKNATRAI